MPSGKVLEEVKMAMNLNKLHARFRTERLYHWQYQCLTIIMAQGNRQMLRVVDERGNHGKYFFSQYLLAMYGFMILDGTVTARDVAHMIKGTEKGFYGDVNRASVEQFNYSSLEAVIVSRKYARKNSGL